MKHALGMSERLIGDAVGVGKTAVGEYLRRARVIGLAWPLPDGMDDAELERRLFTPMAFTVCYALFGSMLLALTPFEYHFSGTGTDEALIVAIALVLMWRIAWRALPPWVAVGGIALALGSFAAAIGAVDQGSALWGAVRWLGVILIMFAAFNVLRERRDASRRMIDIFTASAVVVVAFALAQKVGVDLLVGAPYLSGQPDSFFGYYTVYAGYVAIAATLATGELLIALGAHRGRRSMLYGVALLVILVGVAISTSRGGLLALGGGWLLLLAFNVRRGPVFVRGVVILAVFAGAAYLATPRATVVKFEQRLD